MLAIEFNEPASDAEAQRAFARRSNTLRQRLLSALDALPATPSG